MSDFTRTWTTIDKEVWGAGPWQDEPDKAQWTDAATGLPCLIVRGPSGALCGYVGVDETHPWFKHGYSDPFAGSGDTWSNTPEGILQVHGGITYSALCQEGDEARFVCHIPEPGTPDHVWWFGFDCAHSGDLSPQTESYPYIKALGFDKSHLTYRDFAYVREQVTSLAQQLAEVSR